MRYQIKFLEHTNSSSHCVILFRVKMNANDPSQSPPPAKRRQLSQDVHVPVPVPVPVTISTSACTPASAAAPVPPLISQKLQMFCYNTVLKETSAANTHPQIVLYGLMQPNRASQPTNVTLTISNLTRTLYFQHKQIYLPGQNPVTLDAIRDELSVHFHVPPSYVHVKSVSRWINLLDSASIASVSSHGGKFDQRTELLKVKVPYSQSQPQSVLSSSIRKHGGNTFGPLIGNIDDSLAGLFLSKKKGSLLPEPSWITVSTVNTSHSLTMRYKGSYDLVGDPKDVKGVHHCVRRAKLANTPDGIDAGETGVGLLFLDVSLKLTDRWVYTFTFARLFFETVSSSNVSVTHREDHTFICDSKEEIARVLGSRQAHLNGICGYDLHSFLLPHLRSVSGIALLRDSMVCCDIINPTSPLPMYQFMRKTQILSTAHQLALISHGSLQQALSCVASGSVQPTVESFLRFEFHKEKCLIPARRVNTYSSGVSSVSSEMMMMPPPRPAQTPQRVTFRGGLVLNPSVGLHSPYPDQRSSIVLFDFASMYPSIVCKYHVCPLTIHKHMQHLPSMFSLQEHQEQQQQDQDESSENDDMETDDLDDVDFSESLVTIEKDAMEYIAKNAVLPQIMQRLIEARRDASGIAGNTLTPPNVSELYKCRERLFKLIANGIYGCMGSSSSVFYSPLVAARITEIGRSSLSRLDHFASSYKSDTSPYATFTVIYGDTDSVMIKIVLPESDTNSASAAVLGIAKSNQ